MEDLVNEVDILSSIIILLSMLLSYFRGFLRECFTIAAWLMSAILSLNLAPSLVPFLVKTPFLEELFLGNCPLTMIISFVLSFVISLTFFSLIITFFNLGNPSETERSILANLDKMGGIIFGFGRSILILIFLIIFLQDFFPRSYLPANAAEKLDASLSNKLLMPSKNFIRAKVSNNASIWLSETYELILKNECREKT